METGPNVVGPLFAAEVVPSQGNNYFRGRRLNESLLEIEFRSQPDALEFRPGDVISVSDGRFIALPESVTMKIAIYTNGWKELSLVWKKDSNTAEQGAAANP